MKRKFIKRLIPLVLVILMLSFTVSCGKNESGMAKNGTGDDSTYIDDGAPGNTPVVGGTNDENGDSDDGTGESDDLDKDGDGVVTPYEKHGKLIVDGVNLVDQNFKPMQLRGVSTHGLQWFPEYVNYDAFKTLRDSYGCNCIRLALYTEDGGYCCGGHETEFEEVVDRGVQAATQLGMYVIIDWHTLSDNDPNTHGTDAQEFFKKMFEKYGDYGNVIYEICNEPNNGIGWNQIYEYAHNVIERLDLSADRHPLILIGTPNWCQDVDQVDPRPLRDLFYDNIMYTLHFYASTHKDDLRNKLITARNNGVPVFISEFSICDASGDGNIDYNSADAWKQLINDNNLSFIAWNLCNKNETSALIKKDCDKLSGWTDDDLSETGRYILPWIKSLKADD